MSCDVWVLNDQRAGAVNQSIALAEAIGLKYEIKTIKYNFLALLPNIFFTIGPIHIKRDMRKHFEAENFPKLIISAGRKNAATALYLKLKSRGKSKIVQIMQPHVKNTKAFDLVVLPQHDHVKQKFSRIVRIIGGLCRLNFNSNPKLFSKNYPQLTNFIGVLIGGNSKHHKFSLSEIEELCTTLKSISVYQHLSLFITFSRRTPEIARKLITKYFSASPNIIYNPGKDSYNPYQDILVHAKYLVATADSISICSEAASTGKPLYIYFPDSFKSKKHRFFIQQLFDLNIARKLENKLNFLTKYYYPPLQEVQKVAQVVKTELLS